MANVVARVRRASVPLLATLLLGTWLAVLFGGATPDKARSMLSEGWPVLGTAALLVVGGAAFAVRDPVLWTGRASSVSVAVAGFASAAWAGLSLAQGHVPASTAVAALVVLTSAAVAAATFLPRSGRGGDSRRAVTAGLVSAGLAAVAIALCAELLLLVPRLVPDLSTGIVLPTATAAERLANSHAAAEDPYVGLLGVGALLIASAGIVAALTAPRPQRRYAAAPAALR